MYLSICLSEMSFVVATDYFSFKIKFVILNMIKQNKLYLLSETQHRHLNLLHKRFLIEILCKKTFFVTPDFNRVINNKRKTVIYGINCNSRNKIKYIPHVLMSIFQIFFENCKINKIDVFSIIAPHCFTNNVHPSYLFQKFKKNLISKEGDECSEFLDIIRQMWDVFPILYFDNNETHSIFYYVLFNVFKNKLKEKKKRHFKFNLNNATVNKTFFLYLNVNIYDMVKHVKLNKFVKRFLKFHTN